MTPRHIPGVFVTIALLGCAPPYQPTPTSDTFKSLDAFKSNEEWIAGVVDRAPFELDCPPEEMTHKNLGKTTIGVTGCGKRAVYNWVAGTWVMNSSSEEGSAAPAAGDEGAPAPAE